LCLIHFVYFMGYKLYKKTKTKKTTTKKQSKKQKLQCIRVRINNENRIRHDML
jgi:hypothetical protein